MIVIDGTDERGLYVSDGKRGPYALFDSERQGHIAGPFRWRWQARLALWQINRRIRRWMTF